MTANTQSYVLHADKREINGKQVKQLRRQGLTPAVCYGHGKTSQTLTVNTRDFKKLYTQAGSSTLIDLVLGEHKPIKVLIHTIQTHPVNDEVLHVDFFQVNLKEKLRTDLNLKYVGTAEAVEVLGGIFLAVKDEVEVECLPEDLVPEIEVDISGLKTFEDSLHISDIQVPKGIEILLEGDEVIAAITPPRSDEEMAELENPIEEATPAETETGEEVVTETEAE